MSSPTNPIFLRQEGDVYALPILHASMEFAAQVRLAFQQVRPDCVAVELPEEMEDLLIRAASRLPDISVIRSGDEHFLLSEPCEACFEGLRSALEEGTPQYCVDLFIPDYPQHKESFPDSYALNRIGLQSYYEAFLCERFPLKTSPQDEARELHMARRLKELSLRHGKVLFVGGFAHVENVLSYLKRKEFPERPSQELSAEIFTLTEESCREVLGEFPWVSCAYEDFRTGDCLEKELIDRQKLILELLKAAGVAYEKSSGNPFQGYHLSNSMKFMRNYALVKGNLLPDLFQILAASRSCVDHNFAYEVWKLATDYPHLRNVDGLGELNLSVEEVWGHSKKIRFQLKSRNPKSGFQQRRKKDRSDYTFQPLHPFGICSFPPEDGIVEGFGNFLRKKGTQVLTEEGARSVPFTSSLEDGIDNRESIRHWFEKKLYVKIHGRPPGNAGSVVLIFDSDLNEDGEGQKFPWRTTWIGEHEQESDMALYATEMGKKIVGPGISRCEYGGFLLTFPPRRLMDVWTDPDYQECRNKPEVLLMAAIDYSIERNIVYVAEKAPSARIKTYAARFGKRIIYLPIGGFSTVLLNKLRAFHVLDGHDRRRFADEYIF